MLSVYDGIDADLFREEPLTPGLLSPIHAPVAESVYIPLRRSASLSPLPPHYVPLGNGARLRRAEQNSPISPMQNPAKFDSLSSTDLLFSLEQAQLSCDDPFSEVSDTSDDNSIHLSDSEMVALGCKRNPARSTNNHGT